MEAWAAWRRLPLTLLRIALLTIAYAAVGVPALQLAIPPGYAAPIFPPAGFMLAAGLIYGYWVLPAAFFGSLLMRLIVTNELVHGQISFPSVALIVALAALLQAAIGTRLAKALCGPVPALDTPQTIVRFVLLCPLVALVGSSISMVALVQQGIVAQGNALFAWWTWWMGDTLGLLVGVPIVLALFGKPRQDWSARKWTVAMPLLAMIGLAAVSAGTIARWENQRVENRFAFDSQKLVNAFRNELRLDVLAATVASHAQAKLDNGSESPRWLSDAPSIRSIGRVTTGASPSGDLASLQVLVDISNRRREDERILGMREVRAALRQALASEEVTASEHWTIGTGAQERVEFLVWIPESGADSAPTGINKLVYAIINVDRLNPKRLANDAGGFAICWVDKTAGGAVRIAGPRDCERPPEGLPLARDYPIQLWGRDWLIRVVATPLYAGAIRSWGAWAFSALAVLAIGATGIFLLLLTARARTVGQLVEFRTAQLEQEKSATREAERARLVAEEATRAKDEFLSRMSHELRTPLNGILGFAQILLGDPAEPLSAQQRKRVEHIETAGWHLLAMIDDLLDLSRIEAGTVRLSLEPIALDLLVEETMTMLSTSAAQQGLAVRTDVDPGARRVLADATRLKQVLANLVSNAIKYNAPGGSVNVTARRGRDDEVLITVSDTGQGMSALQLSELFQPFNRLGRDLGPAQGTGIGLVVTKKLVELMHGRIDVRSVEGQGSTFTVTLPAAHADLLVGSQTDQERERGARYGAKRVAYIEDNPLNAEVMRALLSLRPQIRLDVYPRAADGLAAIRKDGFDLLLLDMNLPDARGIDVLRYLKDDPATQHLPVIIVSADTVADHLREALRAGALAYIAKPIEGTQALEKIDRALQGPSAPALSADPSVA